MRENPLKSKGRTIQKVQDEQDLNGCLKDVKMKFQTIISLADLAVNLETPNWIILDCRCGLLNSAKNYKKYVKSHIPNAYYCCFTENRVTRFDSKPSVTIDSVSEINQIIESLRENGLNEKSQIILYEDLNSSFTDTIWLKLRSQGIQNVAVLQGGFTSWIEQNWPVTVSTNVVKHNEVSSEIISHMNAELLH